MLAIERLVFRSSCMLAGMSWRGTQWHAWLSACFCDVVSETMKRPKSLRVTERLREASTCNHVSTKYDATTGVPNQVCVYEVLCLSWLVAHLTDDVWCVLWRFFCFSMLFLIGLFVFEGLLDSLIFLPVMSRVLVCLSGSFVSLGIPVFFSCGALIFR